MIVAGTLAEVPTMGGSGEISDYCFDSSGTLSTLESLSSDFSDDSDPGTLNADPPAPPLPPPMRPPMQRTVVDQPSSKLSSKPTRKAKPAPKPATKQKQKDQANDDGAVVTTGAFFTRATLRQLGMMVGDSAQKTCSGDGIRVGSRVRVLSLDKKWYGAVVLAVKAGKALVHYPEWDHSYNEWVGVDSRRLMYKGKVPEDASIAEWTEKDDEMAVDIDIEQAIAAAYGLGQDDDLEEDDVMMAEASPAHESLPTDQLCRQRPGRPAGSLNRRVAGKHKAASTKRRRKQPPPIVQEPLEPPIADGDSLVDDNAEAEKTAAAVVSAPLVPKELRIADARVFRATHNPYARFPPPGGASSSESDSEPEIAHDGKGSDGDRHSDRQGGGSDGGDSLGRNRKRSRIQKQSSDCDDPGCQPGLSYVTTGAFMTRRAVKCLASSEASGGIMQDHHGYYPGELTEVLNANRKWYVGRVISYVDKKFLVHYAEWGHGHNEWIAAGSKRMRKLRDSPMARLPGYKELLDETEQQARKICAVLVDEYNRHVEGLEQQKREKDRAKRKNKAPKKLPVNLQVANLASSVLGANTPSAEASAAVSDDDEDDEDDLPDVESISVDSGYKAVPQMLRVKDYSRIYHTGMKIAARDRNRLWWRAEITDVKTFRIRVHYTGFSRRWDEWMEMNTQRILLAIDQPHESGKQPELVANAEPLAATPSGEEDSPQPEPSLANTGHDDDDDQQSRISEVSASETQYDARALAPKPARGPGRPPGPETKSAPLSLRLALKAAMEDKEAYEQAHPEESGVFPLPKEHMTMKDYSIFLQVGDSIRVRDRAMLWHTCTIISVKHGRIRVCFDGHSSEFNQWINVNSERIRVLRDTVERDGRLETIERESRIALRRKREKNRVKRKLEKHAAAASLARLAENLEYVAKDWWDEVRTGANDPEETPLVQLMLLRNSSLRDSTPLMYRMMFMEKYLKAHASRPAMAGDSSTWYVYCNQCNVVIRTFRYYCTECEKPSDGYDYESFDLCLMCFSQQFPTDHLHKRPSFARAAICDVDEIVDYTTKLLSSYHTAGSKGRSEENALLQGAADMLTGSAAAYELDTVDTSIDYNVQAEDLWRKLAIGLHGTTVATSAMTKSAVIGPIARFAGRSRILSDAQDDDSSGTAQKSIVESLPRCAFCGDADPCDDALGGFVNNHPFILTTTTESGSVRRQRFWAHYACAKHSPEVLVSKTDPAKWYNVAVALRRARTIKCAGCKQRGASIGCFYERCQRSYHVACTDKPIEYFDRGRLFWCRKHANGERARYNKPGRPVEKPKQKELVVTCAGCHRDDLATDLMWMTCLECPADAAGQFNMCLTCYESKDALANHPHKKRCFREHIGNSNANGINGGGKGRLGGNASRTQRCHYCRRTQSPRWRKGYGGMVMCESCFSAAHTLHTSNGSSQRTTGIRALDAGDIIDDENDDDPGELELVALNPFGSNNPTSSEPQLGALVEDYTQSIYFTREACISSNRVGAPVAASQQPLGALASYGPTDSMLFTLLVDSSYFDIPGRAPRWGSHSGTDYHGTWLPQTVRRALLRYTRRGERVLSNFLGRGTDAIECFLLSRKCIGVDINPSAVALSQRNCSFQIPEQSDMSVEFRPVIMQGDARNLCADGWPGAQYFAEPESYDHILSHPPYKDCVLYSTNIDGDLSRFPGPAEFQREMCRVIEDSWRLLKMGRYVTVGIGDNRAECFYIHVSYQLVRSYINCGFELDELLVKRQRYCQAFGLGTYLCVQFDFLMFTHEFIATLKKVPKDAVDPMYLPMAQYDEDVSLGFHHADSVSAAETTDAATDAAKQSRPCMMVSVAKRALRAVPVSPIDRKSVVMGSVWTFEPHPTYSFPHLCMSRMVERFGRDNSNWEQIDLTLTHPRTTPTNAAHPADDNSDSDSDSGDEPTDGTSLVNYEKERQRQIERNRNQLLQLGLVSELGEESTDISHYRKMLTLPPRESVSDTPLGLIVVPHIPERQFLRAHIADYRRALVQITHDASRRLPPAGLLVVGVQDVRDEFAKLWPLGMLVLEDVQSAVGEIRLRLKEFIVVVEQGHARKRDDVINRDSFVEEKCVIDCDNTEDIHVPIVHAYYLVFMKLK